MIAILLCAGFGTRMYPITAEIAKALLPVAGRPVLDYFLDQLLELNNLEEIHLVANNRFFSQFENWRDSVKNRLTAAGVKLYLYNDGVNTVEERLGAVGDLHFILDQGDLWQKDALVAAGDNIFLFAIKPYWQQFLQERKNCIFGIVENELAVLRRTGVIEVAEDSRVIGFMEKPSNPVSNLFCPPLYFLTAEALEMIERFDQNNHTMDAIGNYVQFLVEKADVYAFMVKGKRLDIGSMADYERANQLLGRK